MQLVYTAVMGRLLEPRDFGLVAAAMIGLRFISYVSRFGLGSAVAQRANLTSSEAATAFRLSGAIGLLAGGVAVATSPLISGIIDQPEAAPIMRAFSVALLAGALGAVPEALLRRSFRFRALALGQVASYGLGYLGVGIGLAVAGAGVWSLVAASVAQSVLLVIITFVLASPPLRGADRASTRGLLAFGGSVSLTGFLEFLGASFDTLMVGRWLSASALGQYSRASYLIGLPVEQATSAVSRVLLPSLSQVQHEPTRFGTAVTRASGVLAGVVMVPITMLAVASPAVVRLLLGPGWQAAAELLPIVGFAQGFALLTNLPAVAAEARGDVHRKLLIQTASFVIVLGLVASVGVAGATLHRLALCWLAAQFARHALYWIFVIPRLNVRRRTVAVRYASAATLAVVASAPLYLVIRVMDASDPGALIFSGVAGVLLGSVAVAAGLAGPLRADVLSLVRNARRSAGPAVVSSAA